MVEKTLGGHSFEKVERFDLSNCIFFRQWERRSVPERQVPLVVIAITAILGLIAVVAIWIVSDRFDWALAIFAIGFAATVYLALYRRTLRFNSLIIAKEFIVWETQCRQPWKFLHRSFPFRNLDLPFNYEGIRVVVPVEDISNWTILQDEEADGTITPANWIVLWRGTLPLRMFHVASRHRATALQEAIRTAIGRMNPQDILSV
jgi:hypothetical protein